MKYDYVIIGAGSAGSIMAARLTGDLEPTADATGVDGRRQSRSKYGAKRPS